jgi:serine/threonine protein kinase
VFSLVSRGSLMSTIDLYPTVASGATPRVPVPSPPCRVGGWELVDRAGEGSLTEVYRARPVGPADRPAAYAVKMLRPEWRQAPQAVAIMRREARVGREVAHPHLVAVLSASVDRPPHYVVMPWLAGRTLARLQAERGPLDLPKVLWIARQVGEALDALHQAGWMHADVKPGNIFVSPEGHVTLLDLGFARRRDEIGSVVDRCVVGTCNYIAPEMITSALRPDIRSDVYSLGVVLFELLAGRLPFTGSNLAELATQHKQARPPDLCRLAPQLPRPVVRLVNEMLAKEPLRRPQTPAELIDRLVELEIETFGQRAGA